MARPVLFIHGAFSTGEVWNDFIPYFKENGFEPICPSLFLEYRTKANPSSDLSILGLNDYLDVCIKNVRQIQREYGEEPIIIGHSMGGLLAQKLAEKNIGKAAIFITSAAPADCIIQNPKTLFSFLNIVLANNPHKAYKPWNFGTIWGILNKVPKEMHAKFIDDMVFESGQALHNIAYPAKDAHKIGVIDETQIGIPTLTIGASFDRTCIVESVRKIAAKYARVGGEYKEYQAGHMIIIEPTKEKLATDIIKWIETL